MIPAASATFFRGEAAAQRRVRWAQVDDQRYAANPEQPAEGTRTPGDPAAGQAVPITGSGQDTPNTGSGQDTPNTGSGQDTPSTGSGRDRRADGLRDAL